MSHDFHMMIYTYIVENEKMHITRHSIAQQHGIAQHTVAKSDESMDVAIAIAAVIYTIHKCSNLE